MFDRKLSGFRPHRAQLYDEGVHLFGTHSRKGWRVWSIRSDQHRLDLHADAAGALAELRYKGRCERVGFIGEHGDTVDRWHQFADKLQPFARRLNGRARYAGD